MARRTSEETGSSYLPWGEEGVVLGAGAVFPLQTGGYGCGGRRHRSAGAGPAPVAGGWQSGSAPPLPHHRHGRRERARVVF